MLKKLLTRLRSGENITQVEVTEENQLAITEKTELSTGNESDLDITMEPQQIEGSEFEELEDQEEPKEPEEIEDSKDSGDHEKSIDVVKEYLSEVDLVIAVVNQLKITFIYLILISVESVRESGVYVPLKHIMYFTGTHYEKDISGKLDKDIKDALLDFISKNSHLLEKKIKKKLLTEIPYKKRICKYIRESFIESLNEYEEKAFLHDTYIINALNGIINLLTGEIRKQEPKDLFLYVINAVYDPINTDVPQIIYNWFFRVLSYDSKKFERNDAHAKNRVESFLSSLAISFTPDTSLRRVFCILGDTRTGKSTLIDFLLDIHGKGGASISPKDILKIRGRDPEVKDDIVEHRNLASLFFSEVDSTDKVDGPFNKRVSGEDQLTLKRSRGKKISFNVRFKIWFATNFFPNITNLQDEALLQRYVVYKFSNGFTQEEYDPSFKEKLMNPKIKNQFFSSMVRYAMKFFEDGKKIDFHKSLEWDLQNCLANQDTIVARFVEEKVTYSSNSNLGYLTYDIYNEFIKFCNTIGYEEHIGYQDFAGKFKRLVDGKKGFKLKSKSNDSGYKNMNLQGVSPRQIRRSNNQFRPGQPGQGFGINKFIEIN